MIICSNFNALNSLCAFHLDFIVILYDEHYKYHHDAIAVVKLHDGDLHAVGWGEGP